MNEISQMRVLVTFVCFAFFRMDNSQIFYFYSTLVAQVVHEVNNFVSGQTGVVELRKFEPAICACFRIHILIPVVLSRTSSCLYSLYGFERWNLLMTTDKKSDIEEVSPSLFI
ncbi:MAG: hypothetical protein AB2598_17060 [Candidatus Thiodiazotropha sp.]